MSNPFIKSLYDKSSRRFAEDTDTMSMTDWISANTKLRGKPFSVEGYEFQKAIIDDLHPNMDVLKCSQVGLTECQIRKALGFLNRSRGVSAIFTLPNEAMFKRVSQTRIKPIVEKTPVFNTERDEKATRSMSVMQFGESFLYVTGCTEGDATSTPADIVFNDEVDISPQDMLALFNSRLQGSDLRISQRFSTPTFPTFGIDLGFQSTDQHLYLYRCPSCNHWNWPEFNKKFITIPGLPDYVEELHNIDKDIIDEIDVNGSYVHCEKCHRPADLGNPELRSWVPKYPGRTHARGYHITPFSTARLGVPYILVSLLKYREREYLRGFFNTVLGMPYADGNIRLEIEAINKCFTPQMEGVEVGSYDPVWAGIDMGQTCHLVLGKGQGVTNMHVFKFEAIHVDNIVARVKEINNKYNLVGGAVDRHPYEPTAQDIFEVSGGKIIPTEYRGTKEVNLVNDPLGNLSHAQSDRTQSLDEVVRQVKAATLRFSGYGHYKQTIIEHLRDLVRDEQPEVPAVWKKLTGQDHFFHSLGFLLVAPKIAELIRALAKDDIRTQTMVSRVFIKDQSINLGSRRKKPLSFGAGTMYR